MDHMPTTGHSDEATRALAGEGAELIGEIVSAWICRTSPRRCGT